MFKTAGFTFGSRLFSAVISFAMIVAISRLLGPEDRGLCALYLVIIALIAGISDIAGGAASAFLLNNYTVKQLQRVQMVWTILPAVCVPFIFYSVQSISIQEAILLVLAGWVHCSWNMQQYLLLGLHKFTRINLANVLVPALSIFLFLVFYYSGWQHRIAYLASISIAWCTAFLSGFIFLKIIDSASNYEPRPFSIKGIFHVGFSNQIAHLTSTINSRLVFFIMPAASLGLWSNSLTLAEAMFLIPGSLGQVLYALEVKNNGKMGTSSHFRTAWWGNLVISSIGLLVLFLLPDSFWVFLFGESFAGIRPLIVFLLPGIFFYSLYLLFSYRQSASGYFIQNFKALSAGLIVNLSYSGLHYYQGDYSVQTAGYGLVLSWIFSAVVAFYLFKKTLPKEIESLRRIPNLRGIFELFANK
jgi:O-antigen/teichoic acid export membrane protein